MRFSYDGNTRSIGKALCDTFLVRGVEIAALWLAVALGAQAAAPTLMKSDDNVARSDGVPVID